MKPHIVVILALGLPALLPLTACDKPGRRAQAPVAASQSDGASSKHAISPQRMADAIYRVLVSDRTAYAKLIVNRLVNQEKVIKASEHWKEDRALLLPAQMFRAGAEIALDNGADFSWSLLSTWPINPKNEAKTEVEKQGLQYLTENPGQNFYGEEMLGGRPYFTAIYPDVAVSQACSGCHNDHKDSPKTDFLVGDLMGGIVVRIPL